jgi:hypothetical protein
LTEAASAFWANFVQNAEAVFIFLVELGLFTANVLGIAEVGVFENSQFEFNTKIN